MNGNGYKRGEEKKKINKVFILFRLPTSLLSYIDRDFIFRFSAKKSALGCLDVGERWGRGEGIYYPLDDIPLLPNVGGGNPYCTVRAAPFSGPPTICYRDSANNLMSHNL